MMRRNGNKKICMLLAAALAAVLVTPCFAAEPSAQRTDAVPLTAEEEQYVNAHPTVSIAIDTSWVPYGFAKADDSCTGIIPNIMQTVAERVGLQVEFVAKDTYADAIQACNSGETMLVSGIADDTRMSEKNHVFITGPYIQIGYSAVMKNEIDDLYADGASYRVAICVGTYAKMAMQDKMPTYEFVEYHTNQECMDAVLHGEAEIALIANYSAGYYDIMHEYRQLQIIQINDFGWGLCFGVNEDCDPMLIEILNKGIATLSDNDVNQAIYQATTDATASSSRISDIVYEQPVLIAAVTGIFVALVALIVFLLWSRKRRAEELKQEQERRVEIEEALQEARRANESKTEFFSRMSHDMRTPMNGILGIANLSKAEQDPAELKRDIAKIEASGQYLLGIINDTLDLQRIESGKLTLEPTVVDCRSVIESAIDMVRPAIGEKHIDFQVVNKDVILDCAVRIDQVRMKQIFVNLISNAIKFTPEGGTITFTFECLGREGSIAHDQFTVQDTGVGMSEDFVHNKLFTPFAQERNKAAEKYAGSGLGLSIVKSLVDLMGGTIEVESELGTGTAFYVCLDIERADPAEAVEITSREKEQQVHAIERLNGRSILLAEDHPLNAEIATKLLERAGCHVVWKQNGQEVLDCFAKSKPNEFDVILMDIRMPVMDGLEAARHIRGLDRTDAGSVPILAMTANAYDEDVRKSLAAGMNAHLGKPIDPAQMYETIAGFFSG